MGVAVWLNMWSLLSLAILSCLAPASPRPQTPFFDFKSFDVPASRFNTQPVRQELKTFSPVRTRNNLQFSSFAPAPIKSEDNPELVSFAPIKPEDTQFVSFAPIEPEDNQEFVSFAPIDPEDTEEFYSFDPLKPEDEEEITRFTPILIEEEKQPVMSLPLTIENGKPMTDVFSMAGPPYTETDEDMTDTVKMVPFVNLGESAPLPEVAEQPVLPELTMTSDKIPKEVIVTTPPPEHPTTTESVSLQEMVKSNNPEVSEKLSSPMTKHTLIQMAVDRLKDMEHKKDVMEIMKNLKEDNLYVLQPVVEGDVIKVSDHPS